MGQKSKYWEKKVLDALFGQTALPAIGTIYCALFTAIPTNSTDSGTEVSSGSYARKAITNNATNWPVAATGTGSLPASKFNGTTITFVAASANWGTILGFGFYDASTSGNLLYWGSLSTPKIINSGATFSFSINSVKITEA